MSHTVRWHWQVLACVVIATLIGVGMRPLTVDATEADPVVVSADIVSAPDNDCPAWARDSFARVTTIMPLPEDADADFSVRFDSVGTWEADDGSQLIGTLVGYVEYTVSGELLDDTSLAALDGETVDLSAYECKADVPAEHSTSTFALRYFAEGAEAGPITAWEYVYETPCTTFVENDESGAVGTGTFAPCPVVPVEPTIAHETCDEPATVTIPDVEGVQYLIDNEHVEPGVSYAAPGTIVVNVSAEPGWMFEREYGWELSIDAAEGCDDEPTPTPTPTPTPSATTPDVGDDLTSGQTLPDTGASNGAFVAFGIVVLALGVTLMLTTRHVRARKH